MDEQGTVSSKRKYGYKKSRRVVGAPVAMDMESNDSFGHLTHSYNGCPYCQCKRVFKILVDLKRSGKDTDLGVYIGCPACEWASPMVVIEYDDVGQADVTIPAAENS